MPLPKYVFLLIPRLIILRLDRVEIVVKDACVWQHDDNNLWIFLLCVGVTIRSIERLHVD